MKSRSVVARIWIDVTGFLLPSLVMVAYVLGWSPAMRAVLTLLCVAGIFGPWLVATDLGRWRAERIARVRKFAGRRGA